MEGPRDCWHPTCFKLDVHINGWANWRNRRYVRKAGVDACCDYRSKHAIQRSGKFAEDTQSGNWIIAHPIYRKRPPSFACVYPSSCHSMRQSVWFKNSQHTKSIPTISSWTNFCSLRRVGLIVFSTLLSHWIVPDRIELRTLSSTTQHATEIP